MSDVNPGDGSHLPFTPKTHQIFIHAIDKVDLEPGESDQCFFAKFPVPDKVRTIQVDTSFPVPRYKGKFWSSTTLFDLGNTEPSKVVTISHDTK